VRVRVPPTPETSYRKAIWLPGPVVEAKRGILLRNFISKQNDGGLDGNWVDNHNINPTWYQVRRGTPGAAPQGWAGVIWVLVAAAAAPARAGTQLDVSH
jgi:hypothetical protein